MSVFTLEMKLLTSIVLEEYGDEVKKELLRLGLLDFIEVATLSKEQHAKLQNNQETRDERVYDIIHQIESLYQQTTIPIPQLTQEDVEKGAGLEINEGLSFIHTIQKSLAKLRDTQKNNNQELHRYIEMARYIKEKKMDYLDFHVGKLQANEVDTLTQRLINNASIILSLETNNTYLLCTFSRDRSVIDGHLEAINFTEDVATHSIHEMVELTSSALNTIIEEKNRENKRIIGSITDMIQSHISELEILYKKARLHELLKEMSSHFAHTRNTTIFSGWVPSEKSEELKKRIQKVCNDKCVVEFGAPKEMNRKEIPVAIQNSDIFTPFQKIVNNYSTVEYGSINPTIFVTVSYLAMFGLMFADAGQGLVLLLLGLYGMYKEKRGLKEGSLLTFSLLRLMMYLGVSSIVAGALFGSYFGFPLFPPIWFDYHSAVFSHSGVGRDVYSILGISSIASIVKE